MFDRARYIFEFPYILRPPKRKLLCKKSVNFCKDLDPFLGNGSEDSDPCKNFIDPECHKKRAVIIIS
jgi:hypothetical protein